MTPAAADLCPPDRIRTLFSQAMSLMYRREVPQYGTLLELVAEVNGAVLAADPSLNARLDAAGELARLDVERHGAIRLGTPGELATMRRLFAVMGMEPVGYYDLSAAGVPVHSTAFRPVADEALARNPFRVFTSLLRLDLVEGEALRAEAAAILARRRIFTDDAMALIERCETAGGLTEGEAGRFVAAALETFRWHGEATVDADTYARLLGAHRLVADVVSFKGPHINHLTPRTLDIDAVQARMPARGIAAKDVVEGPPPRRCPILLRQTSFKALEEPIRFAGAQVPGRHTARFGEIEQRGLALTRKGRALYDAMLAEAQAGGRAGGRAGELAREREEPAGSSHEARLAAAFAGFPDDEATLRREGLGFFRYRLAPGAAGGRPRPDASADDLVAGGWATADPVVYEDFLPVSAAGIFQSNLGGGEARSHAGHAAQAEFEAALGAPVHDAFALYADAERRSLEDVRAALAAGERHAAA